MTKPEKLRLLKEGLWITAGQGIAAGAALAGVRFVTELAVPSLYGAFTLINGVFALLQGMALLPLAQAALRFYPDYEVLGVPHLLRRWLVGVFWRRWQGVAAISLVAAIIDTIVFHYLSLITWGLIVITFGLDAWKTVEIVIRNAARKQESYAILLGTDALTRVMGTVLIAWLFSPSIESLLFGQALGASIPLMAIYLIRRESCNYDSSKIYPKAMIKDFENRMKSFASPLILLPLFGWLSGLADRYIVGGFIGLDAAGVYAAAYGLSSRPLLMVGAVTDATFRQPLYTAVSNNRGHMTKNVINNWITLNVLVGLCMIILFSIQGEFIAEWLLALEYRTQAKEFMPIVALGYVFVLANQVMERLLYAKHRTNLVTIVEAMGSFMALCGALIGCILLGLKGVVLAVPIYFGAQLVLTTFIALCSGDFIESDKRNVKK